MAELGIFCKTVDSSIIEAAALSNINFIILDREHGNASWTEIQNMINAAKDHDIKVVVRTRDVNPSEIGKSFDCGADGVQIPNISSVEEAKLAISSAKFHPLGKRGVCRFVKSANFGSMEKDVYFSKENKKQVILQIEGVNAIDKLNDILEIDHIDVIFIGPYDLSQSVGKPGDINSQEVEALIAEIVSKCKNKGIKVGIFADEILNAKKYINLGIGYVAYSVDVNIFTNALNLITKEVR